MTNFRKLCDELLDELQYQTDWSVAEELKERARAALTEPEPEGPTDEELEEEFGSALLKLPGNSLNATAVSFARAILTRWGK